MTEGKIVSWSKKVGDKVNAGDVLLIVESDKADMDVESFEDGYLAAILTPEGGSAAVGSPVAIIVDKKEEINNVSKTPTPAAPAYAPAPPVSAVPAATTTTTSASKPANCENLNMPALR
jgi:pyruvate dehydrogenase E2 component (dihydrolipoamide acetyltransferase)